ncbi:MAG TPA: hypothetical protein VFN31_01675 [Candidatus Saccharimonadales bacterium]|nr:hypothetical protein [Candidatus Saccharimonadales bacterium]
MERYGTDLLYFRSFEQAEQSVLFSLDSCLKWLVYTNEDMPGERELFDRLTNAAQARERAGERNVSYGTFGIDAEEASVAINAVERCKKHNPWRALDLSSPNPVAMLAAVPEVQEFIDEQRASSNSTPLC